MMCQCCWSTTKQLISVNYIGATCIYENWLKHRCLCHNCAEMMTVSGMTLYHNYNAGGTPKKLHCLFLFTYMKCTWLHNLEHYFLTWIHASRSLSLLLIDVFSTLSSFLISNDHPDNVFFNKKLHPGNVPEKHLNDLDEWPTYDDIAVWL